MKILFTAKIYLAFIILLWAPSLGAVLGSALVSVAVPPENTVGGSRILLGDIAFIDLLNPAGQALSQDLAALDLGASPAMGARLVLNRNELQTRLLASGLDFSKVAFSLPSEIVLTNRGQELSEESLQGALEKYLAGTEPYQSGSWELVSVNFSRLPTLPPGQINYRFVPQSSTNPTYLTGNFFFTVDGKGVGRARVTAQVELSVEVVVAARSLRRGHVLSENDLSLGWVPFSQTRGTLTEIDLAVGAALKSHLAAGEPLEERDLGKNILVRRGDTVSIVARQGGLKVTASGEAREEGSMGETISVINLNSKKIITGRIIGPSQVEIVF